MKTVRILIFLLLFGFLPQVSYCQDEASAENDFPDLLADEFDELEEDAVEYSIHDPLEPVNRFFFGFNDIIYEAFLKPVTHGYMWVVPREIRTCFGNFFFYLASPVRLLNSLLQGDIQQAGVVLERFVINSTLGVYGLVDIASIEFDLEPPSADFGQTLGKWGMDTGFYICWPLAGPSSVRDSFGLLVDAYTHPVPYFHDSRTLDVAYYTSNIINTLSLNPDLYDDMKKYSLDPYVASRQAYYEYRQAISR
jgi:phospholipid-binding lipoprotein MlaA